MRCCFSSRLLSSSHLYNLYLRLNDLGFPSLLISCPLPIPPSQPAALRASSSLSHISRVHRSILASFHHCFCTQRKILKHLYLNILQSDCYFTDTTTNSNLSLTSTSSPDGLLITTCIHYILHVVFLKGKMRWIFFFFFFE